MKSCARREVERGRARAHDEVKDVPENFGAEECFLEGTKRRIVRQYFAFVFLVICSHRANIRILVPCIAVQATKRWVGGENPR